MGEETTGQLSEELVSVCRCTGEKVRSSFRKSHEVPCDYPESIQVCHREPISE